MPSRPGRRDGHAVILGAQPAIDEIGDPRLVFDQEHVQLAASGWRGRQSHGHGRSFTQAARHFDLSLMGLDDGLGDRQSQSQSLLIVLGGIAAAPEAFEDPLKLLRRDADAPIRDS